MESSEDDAGPATIASRRASARERDVGQAEDLDAPTGIYQQDRTESRTSCQTPAMSEDNFDGDSVPSPSVQDVNTSTEAILDMIDEIVDGPGAPKRIPIASDTLLVAHEIASEDDSGLSQELLNTNSTESLTPIPDVSPALDVNADDTVVNSSATEQQISAELNIASVNSENMCQERLLIPTEECTTTEKECIVSQVELEPSSSQTLSNIPSSSAFHVQSVSETVSESEKTDRTVKCVTSSEIQNRIRIESAESTSSDCSVSEDKIAEPTTKVPLRRRLVRPARCDRRSDCTVSSSVDLKSVNINTIVSVSENVPKDVTSSSDSNQSVHEVLRPEVSVLNEISISKIEIPAGSPKKIKLIRQKPVLKDKESIVENLQQFKVEKEQCQPTSSGTVLISEITKDIPCNLETSQPLKSTDSLNVNKSEDCPSQTNDVNDISLDSCEAQKIQKSEIAVNMFIETNLNAEPKYGSAPDFLSFNVNDVRENENDKNESVSLNAVSEVLTGLSETSSNKHNQLIVDVASTSNKETLNAKVIPKENSSLTQEEKIIIPPIKLNVCLPDTDIANLNDQNRAEVQMEHIAELEPCKQVPKLTIKLGIKPPEEVKSPIPKVTIKSIRTDEQSFLRAEDEQEKPTVTKFNIKPILKPQSEIHETSSNYVKDEENDQQILSVTRLNIKPIPKPQSDQKKTHSAVKGDHKTESLQIPSITKLNIKPVLKPPEKINDSHRQSSSSEISESEYSENDETTSTSDHASASDHGSEDVPKVTIRLGKVGTESEGKFYTDQNVPKFTIKSLQNTDTEIQETNLKLLITSQSDEKRLEKIPKLTIKTVTKTDSQPLSPKLTIKPLKSPDGAIKESEIPKLKITSESYCGSPDYKDSSHVPKITIKPITKMDVDSSSKTFKKSFTSDVAEQIPIITKLNIKPVLKLDCGETSNIVEEKVPVISKLNIKPVLKPKDNDNIDSNVENVPKITKLNIKPIKNPEENSSDEKDCDGLNADTNKDSVPVVTKINIKPIVKPLEEDISKDSENQSSETGNSSDDNADHIPVVTKLNIKPIIKPADFDENSRLHKTNEQSIPTVTRLNIKPLVKPEEINASKKESLKSSDSKVSSVPVVTKLNIKPVTKSDVNEIGHDENKEEVCSKNPPIVMKINMKAVAETASKENVKGEHSLCNNVNTHFSLSKHSTEMSESRSEGDFSENLLTCSQEPYSSDNSKTDLVQKGKIEEHRDLGLHNCVTINVDDGLSNIPNIHSKNENLLLDLSTHDSIVKHVPVTSSITTQSITKENHPEPKQQFLFTEKQVSQKFNVISTYGEPPVGTSGTFKQKSIASSLQNCTLLKKLLENTKEPIENIELSHRSTVNCLSADQQESQLTFRKDFSNCNIPQATTKGNDSDSINYNDKKKIISTHSININENRKLTEENIFVNQGICEKSNENLTKPLEISISEKVVTQSSEQDSPRIILKINKTDHGPSAKIITEETKRPDSPHKSYIENIQEKSSEKESSKRYTTNSKRRQNTPDSPTVAVGKRLRSSRIVESVEKSPIIKRNTGKRSTSESSPPQMKDTEISILDNKRLKLEQLLTSNKSLTITPVASKISPTSPTKSIEIKQSPRSVNHSILNNENCAKNGNSKLHNILSNLQAKQMQSISLIDSNNSIKSVMTNPEVISDPPVSGMADVTESVSENCHPKVQEMLINENSDFRDNSIPTDEASQDPLEVDTSKISENVANESSIAIRPEEFTPQPKKRGRPRKLPTSEGAKPVTLPVTALEERPQRSLRLTRERPSIVTKPRGGRGRGRGGRRAEAEPSLAANPTHPTDNPTEEIDPTSSRVKLPRLTEALDRMPGGCVTPLSSRRRGSVEPEPKVVLEAVTLDEMTVRPESTPGRGRGSRGGRTPRGRTPRSRARGRGGGRGAVYMKETLGIYGRVCGPATTTVQLFEEETCMMDDNATPAKPSHLLDEDSQSSIKSLTNESSKLKKSKFADLFDSNKQWTAADVKEYIWPHPGNSEPQVMMIQEQVAMFLGVKSFKRRYPELKRRSIVGDEKDYVLAKRLATEALCDLGITAVDASEVLDIMLSDYPHKYEEYRAYQRERQLTEPEEIVTEVKMEDKLTKSDVKSEKSSDHKPEGPKIDPEKLRQDMAAAAIASASEWNARMNASRSVACVDLQSMTVHRRRPPAPRPAHHVRPPAGFYPHALLPGQYQHAYRIYTPEQLRYFPLNTVLAAPPASVSPECSSESEPESGSASDSSVHSDSHTQQAKRKRVSKVKRSSQAEKEKEKEKEKELEPAEVEDTCRACKLRLEGNRKHTHERFLVCATCNAKLHPGCVELGPDTIRKCREYPWQCAECKTCGQCSRPADDDKMLFCDLCDRGFHSYCVGLPEVPTGRWHCVECAICKSCGARSPAGAAAAGGAAGDAAPEWHHQTKRGPGGHKVYSHSLCTPCARTLRCAKKM
ncbi:supporter of activation of yellow protein isoform X2 [Bombyx mori]|uniref:PHD-type domain-containing protein n=1 Tax=Bombyx mori TaxID=7091 RepID=A0A8R2M3N3_BOMMO|nr:supporter of activation of yellow protein isoform X3 [Bombyx mori]